jgi:anti-sigma factor RsiW
VNCQPTLIHGYADRELDAATTLVVEEHLRECDACSRTYENLQALHTACSAESLYFEMPAGLERKIRSAARGEMRRAGSLRMSWRPLLATAATALIVTGLVVFVLLRGRAGADIALADQVVSDHVRSLQVPGRNVDVISTDHHTVKPWLASHLDFAPDMPDLPADGFKLEGGRLDYLNNRPAAALVYQYRKHVIDVFVWPTDRTQTTPPAFLQRQGYWLAHWTEAGLNHWAITDASEDALHDFVDHWCAPPHRDGKTPQ